jgi:hypothetical protein
VLQQGDQIDRWRNPTKDGAKVSTGVFFGKNVAKAEKLSKSLELLGASKTTVNTLSQKLPKQAQGKIVERRDEKKDGERKEEGRECKS